MISAVVMVVFTSCDLFKSRDFDDSTNTAQSSVTTDSVAAVAAAPDTAANQKDSTSTVSVSKDGVTKVPKK